MKSILTSIFIVSTSIVGFAQETFQFNIQLKPNSTYIMDLKMDLDLKMNFDLKDKELLKEMKPVVMKNVMDAKIKTVSQSKDNNGVPFSISYEKIKNVMTLNGEINPAPTEDPFKELYSFKIKGIDTKEGRTLTGFEGPKEYEPVFNILYEGFKNFGIFPKDKFVKGQSNSITNVFNLPMPGGVEYKIDIISNYTFIKIENGIAHFDVVMNSTSKISGDNQLKMDLKQYDIKGKLFVNVDDHNIYKSNFEGPMVLTTSMNEGNINVDSYYHYIINSQKQ